MPRSFIVRLLSMLLIGLIPGLLMAEDTLASVMARMKPGTAVRISYQETRYLDLINEPWHGSGYLYAMSPDIMVKDQIDPAPEIAGASSRKMYYYDPINQIRHEKHMSGDDPISLNILVFQALINGDQALLEKMFLVEFSSGMKSWQLIMTAKNKEAREVLAKVEVTGLPEQPAKKIIVHLADGDYSEYMLENEGEGEAIKDIVSSLMRQLKDK